MRVNKLDVGLVGLAGSGKDSASVGLRNLGWKRKAFADKLKYFSLLIGWDGAKDRAGRTFLQELGCSARKYDSEIWINHAKAGLHSYEHYVWTDVRFFNEAQFIHERGGILVRIVRPGNVNDGHISETEQENIEVDYEIVNDGSEEELQQKLVQIVKNHNK